MTNSKNETGIVSRHDLGIRAAWRVARTEVVATIALTVASMAVLGSSIHQAFTGNELLAFGESVLALGIAFAGLSMNKKMSAKLDKVFKPTL